MKITNFSVVPNIVVPGENMHCEFTIKVESGDECNGLQVYAGNASYYMAYWDLDWRLAAGKSQNIAFDRTVPTHLSLINDNLANSRTYTDPKWTIQMGNFGTAVTITNPVTYMNMRYLPTIAEFSLERATNGLANDEGENVLTTLRLSVADGAITSDMSLKLYYAKNSTATTSSSCIDLSNKIDSLLTGVTDSTSLIANTFSNGSDWNFMLVFGDELETTTARFSLARSFANVHMSGCKTGGICCGGFSSATEGNPKFESYYPIFAYGGLEPIETALCILKTVRYLQDIPACAAMAPNQLIQKVSADVLEELELCHANKPQNQTTRGVHAHQEEQ